MKKACVIGWPISHSRSPLIHNYWLKLYGIAGDYLRVPVEAGALDQFIAGLPESEYRGCNVTIPHKERAWQLVAPADEMTKRLGSVNTIYHRDGRLLGTSTDGEGFIANLAANAGNLKLKNEKALVLGAGGAAMAIVGALLDRGLAEIAVANRTLERSDQLRARFGSAVKPEPWENRDEAVSESALLVNATALGMVGQPPLHIDLARLPAAAIVADIVYSPLQTPLLAAAAKRGNATVGGLGMLLHQAVRGFELWFGRRPEVTQDIHDLVARDIDPGYQR
ncbi:MAG: shikimate dehydrogenase [Rhizobiales bacterium]|nr:shikimate dehydrogenase [Hyphomicrobiales bacterium]